MTCWMSMATKIEKRVKPQRMITAHCWSVQVGATLPVFLTVSALALAGEAAVLLVLAMVVSCVLGLKVPTS